MNVSTLVVIGTIAMAAVTALAIVYGILDALRTFGCDAPSCEPSPAPTLADYDVVKCANQVVYACWREEVS